MLCSCDAAMVARPLLSPSRYPVARICTTAGETRSAIDSAAWLNCSIGPGSCLAPVSWYARAGIVWSTQLRTAETNSPRRANNIVVSDTYRPLEEHGHHRTIDHGGERIL